MAEYISREAAMLQIDAADFVRDDNFEGGATLLFCDDVVDRLSAIPAADVRPVVLCRDCKWYQIDELKKDGTEDRRYKPSVCVLAEQRRDPNHFCAGGEKGRKADGRTGKAAESASGLSA